MLPFALSTLRFSQYAVEALVGNQPAQQFFARVELEPHHPDMFLGEPVPYRQEGAGNEVDLPRFRLRHLVRALHPRVIASA